MDYVETKHKSIMLEERTCYIIEDDLIQIDSTESKLGLHIGELLLNLETKLEELNEVI